MPIWQIKLKSNRILLRSVAADMQVIKAFKLAVDVINKHGHNSYGHVYQWIRKVIEERKLCQTSHIHQLHNVVEDQVDGRKKNLLYAWNEVLVSNCNVLRQHWKWHFHFLFIPIKRITKKTQQLQNTTPTTTTIKTPTDMSLFPFRCAEAREMRKHFCMEVLGHWSNTV